MEATKRIKVLMMNCDNLVNLDEIKKHLFLETHEEYFSVKSEYFCIDEIHSRSKELDERSRDEKHDIGIFAVHANESRLSINEKKAGIGYARIYNSLRQITDDNVVVVIAHDSNYKDSTCTLSSWARFKVSSQFIGEYMNGPNGYVFSWKKNPEKCHKEKILQLIKKARPDMESKIIGMYKEREYVEPKKVETKIKARRRPLSSKAKGESSDESTYNDERDQTEKEVTVEAKRISEEAKRNHHDVSTRNEERECTELKNVEDTKIEDSKPSLSRAKGETSDISTRNKEHKVQTDKEATVKDKSIAEEAREIHHVSTENEVLDERAMQTYTSKYNDEEEVYQYNAQMTEQEAIERAEGISEVEHYYEKPSSSEPSNSQQENTRKQRPGTKKIAESTIYEKPSSSEPSNSQQEKTRTQRPGTKKIAESTMDKILEMLSLKVLLLHDAKVDIDMLSSFYENGCHGLEVIVKRFSKLNDDLKIPTLQADFAVLVLDVKDITKKLGIIERIYGELCQQTGNQVIVVFGNDQSNEEETSCLLSSEISKLVRPKLDETCIDGPVGYVLSWKTAPLQHHKEVILKMFNKNVISKRHRLFDKPTLMEKGKKLVKKIIYGDSQEKPLKEAVQRLLNFVDKKEDMQLVAIISCISGSIDRSLEVSLLQMEVRHFVPLQKLPSWIEETNEYKKCEVNPSVVGVIFRKRDERDGNYTILTYDLESK
ncbi:uncharacterized protein LOC144438936 [Glandiceps talaboti]